MVKKANNKKFLLTKIYVIFLLISCIIFARPLIYQVKEKHRLNLEIETLKDNAEKLEKEIDTLKSDLNNVENEDFIKKVAREKLKMIDKNEVIIKYKD